MGSDERMTELERELIEVRIRLSRLERELLRLSADGMPLSTGASPAEDPRHQTSPPRVPWLRAVEGFEEEDPPEA